MAKAVYRSYWQIKNGIFLLAKRSNIKNPADFTWKRVLESSAAADTVLKFEKELSKTFSPDPEIFLLKNVMELLYASIHPPILNHTMKN
ncbi:MAG: hypothetical protein WDO19_14880 [Bacteroidota bacterium]